MPGVTTGILCNALPLSAEHVKSIEKDVLENQETFAYIDENSELCFSLPSEPDVIKDLAWNNAYELCNVEGILTKHAYRKTGLETFTLDKTFIKNRVEDSWSDSTMPTERLEGDGQEFYTTAPSTLSFRSTAPLDEFQDVQINGETVDPANYTLEEGSTIVKLKHDYLSTLNVGKYELSVVSDSKTVKGDFTVKAPELNESGFYYSQVYYGGEVSLGDNFNGELAFFITESNECFLINYSSGDCSSVTMTQEENLYTIYLYDDVYIKGYFTEGGVFKGTESFASGGKWAPDYIGEGVDFTLFSGDHRAASDGSMLYIKDPSAEGYRVAKCFSTAEKIDNIKTNIVNLPVTRINSSCFNGCDHLKELVIPDFMSDIYSNTILGADNIEKITVPYIPPSFGGDTNVLSFLGNTSNSIHTFILTEGETRIIDKAFCETALTNITLPSTLVHIGWHAFSSSPALTNIVFNGTTEQWNAIEKVPDWNYDIPATYVQCSDGQVAL